jgi:hypothetical protein
MNESMDKNEEIRNLGVRLPLGEQLEDSVLTLAEIGQRAIAQALLCRGRLVEIGADRLRIKGRRLSASRVNGDRRDDFRAVVQLDRDLGHHRAFFDRSDRAS